MFPIQIHLTVGTHAELQRLTAFLEQNTAANVASAPRLTYAVSAEEKAALVSPSARDESPEPGMARGTPKATAGEAPGKSAATPAATPSTATPAAASTAKSEPASPTSPPAAAPAAEGEFKYETLQKAVNAAVPKFGKDKLLAIAKAHGADNFKGLPASAWAAAHADVLALG